MVWKWAYECIKSQPARFWYDKNLDETSRRLVNWLFSMISFALSHTLRTLYSCYEFFVVMRKGLHELSGLLLVNFDFTCSTALCRNLWSESVAKEAWSSTFENRICTYFHWENWVFVTGKQSQKMDLDKKKKAEELYLGKFENGP